MNNEKLKRCIVFTKAINYDYEENEKIKNFINLCLKRFLNLDFNEKYECSKIANKKELEKEKGRVIARYENNDLDDDVLIISYFNNSCKNNIDCNNTTIMYCNEY